MFLLAGNKKRSAWIVGLINQFLWLIWIFTIQAWGLLPNGEWKEFTLETNTTIVGWSTPIIIKEYSTYPSLPVVPWQPWYVSGGTKYLANTKTAEYSASARNTSQLKSGVFNVEV